MEYGKDEEDFSEKMIELAPIIIKDPRKIDSRPESNKLNEQNCQEQSYESEPQSQSSILSPGQKKKKGCALLLSNGFEKDSNGYNREAASNNDINMMKCLWNKMGCDDCDVHICKNESADNMRMRMTDFAKKEGKYDYLVVYISTHGGISSKFTQKTCWDIFRAGCIRTRVESVVFFGEDNKSVAEKELMDFFRNDSCKHVGVTKLFILDYCRGDGEGRSKAIDSDGGEHSAGPPVPIKSDIVTIYATHRYYKAFQNHSGSLLTKELYDVFNKNWTELSLLNMLTMVNNRMMKATECVKMAESMSIFESSLVNDFLFYESQDLEDGVQRDLAST